MRADFKAVAHARRLTGTQKPLKGGTAQLWSAGILPALSFGCEITPRKRARCPRSIFRAVAHPGRLTGTRKP